MRTRTISVQVYLPRAQYLDVLALVSQNSFYVLQARSTIRYVFIMSPRKNTMKSFGSKKKSKSKTNKALNTMENEGQTLRQAASNFGVPKSTLYAKLKNLSPLDSRKGPETILTKDEEDSIVKWILFCSKSGCPVTKTRLFDCVQNYILEVYREYQAKSVQE
ncbi:hypothetical protein TSAR_003414 [Trichomalopsis sarcophagae]|uniref:HTH psq-type domain-containing protein n=1 Tax=Trichomalopsis sarcophagae TaxID=543379 RepID=A0A232FII9_9HYME|nr:hypothetical protein TSAR_003414 [Trichomalopsis sarcophagae]